MGTREVEFLGRGYIQPGSRGAFRTKPQSAGISPDFNTLILIGPSDNGPYTNDLSLPLSKRVLEFGGPDEARQILGSGDLADAVVCAFSPSKDSRFANGPQTIKALNVSQNKSASALVTTLGITKTVKAITPGPKGNQLRFRVSNNGTILQVADNENILTSQTLEANDIRIQYIGNASNAILSFDGITLRVTLSGTASTDLSKDLVVDIKSYETLSELVSYISSQVGYTATLLSQPDRKTNTLDHILLTENLDVKSIPQTLKSLLFRQESFFNSSGLLEIISQEKNLSLIFPVLCIYRVESQELLPLKII